MQIILVNLLTQAYIFMIKKIFKYQQKLKMWCFSSYTMYLAFIFHKLSNNNNNKS